MKVKNINGTSINVFGIYWDEKRTYFLGLPRNHGNLIIYTLKEVSIEDPVLNSNFVYHKNGIYHWALMKNNLLNDIIDREDNAYETFLEIIKSEGLVDPDFY